MVRIVSSISEVLALPVMAEGVENAEQRDWLLKHGIRSGQGFLFARRRREAFEAEFCRAAPRRVTFPVLFPVRKSPFFSLFCVSANKGLRNFQLCTQTDAFQLLNSHQPRGGATNYFHVVKWVLFSAQAMNRLDFRLLPGACLPHRTFI